VRGAGVLTLGKPQYFIAGRSQVVDQLLHAREVQAVVHAADWSEMLMRMYIRWAEQHNYQVEVFDTSYAEEAGIKRATFAVHAPFAYGKLSVEQGTHRLVRISPFDDQSRRQTSFANVEVLPVTETDHIDIPESDVRADVYRSSGPGGQSVNTTDSAVRLTHIPTGIAVTCHSEKSQLPSESQRCAFFRGRHDSSRRRRIPRRTRCSLYPPHRRFERALEAGARRSSPLVGQGRRGLWGPRCGLLPKRSRT
jgi:peptide chain release factor 2